MGLRVRRTRRYQSPVEFGGETWAMSFRRYLESGQEVSLSTLPGVRFGVASSAEEAADGVGAQPPEATGESERGHFSGNGGCLHVDIADPDEKPHPNVAENAR